MGWEVKIDMRHQSKCDLWGSSVKRKFLPGSQKEQNRCTFCTQQIQMLCGMGHPFMHTTCSQIGGGVFTDYKSSNRIRLSQFKTYCILVICHPIGVGGWMNGWVGCPTHLHTKIHTCTHAHMPNISKIHVKKLQMANLMGHLLSCLTCLCYVCTCLCI